MPEVGTPYQQIGVTLLRSGQPRPYADHERVYRVKIEQMDWRGGGPHPWLEGYDDPDSVLETQLVNTARMVVASHMTDRDQRAGYWEPYVDYAKKVGPGEVEVRIIEPHVE